MTTIAPESLTEWPPEVIEARERHATIERVVHEQLRAWESFLPDGPQEYQDRHEKLYRAALEDEERARRKLAAIEKRHAARLEQIAEAENLRRWSDVRKLVSERRKLAGELDGALAEVEAVREKLYQVDRQIRSTHPFWHSNLPFGDVFIDSLLQLAISKREWYGVAMWDGQQAAGMPGLLEQVRRHERTLLHGAPA